MAQNSHFRCTGTNLKVAEVRLQVAWYRFAKINGLYKTVKKSFEYFKPGRAQPMPHTERDTHQTH